MQFVKEWLSIHETLSTREIYDLFLDESPKSCPTMYELGNLLSKSKDFELTGEMHLSFYTTSRRRINAVWKLKEEVV